MTACDYVRSLPACDFLRTLAGRPSSAEISAKKAMIDTINAIQARNARLARIADSLAIVDSLAAREQFVVDSLTEAGSLSVPKNKIVWSSDTYADSLAHNYYVMVGAFSVKSNAEKLKDIAASAGYEPVLLRLANGFHAVALNGSDYAREIAPVYESIKSEEFCPKGAWVLSK